MPQQHLDRLTSIDASFLHQEGPASHMHIGGVLIFDGPAPECDQYLDHVRSRLHLVPRYRQRLATPPLEAGRPLWVDDPTFNLEYHIRHAALPAPGTEQQLFQLTARIASQQLDRSKPLWESWLVEGLEGDRFALIFKTHHALVDGVSGVDLATVLLDLSPVPSPAPADLEPWRPHTEPSSAELILAGVRGAVATSAELVSRAVQATTRPARSFELIRDAAEGLGEIVWAGLNPAPETPLNVEIGPHRRYAVVRQQLSDYKEVKNALGGTVNDVVLAVVSGALARWLRSRGVRTEGLEMRALVPVSVRAADERGTLGNRLAAMRGPLPVYIKDPVARLRFVKQEMDGLKESKQAVGAATLAAVNNLAPPTILAQASRLNFSTRLFNLIVTNIPGPQLPLYVLGRELRDLFPLAFLPERHGLAVAIMSYNGRVEYGLLADYDALPDVSLIAEGIEASLQELVQAARDKAQRASAAKPKRASTRSSNGAPAPIVPSPRPRAQSGPAADMRAKRSSGSRRPRKPPES
ncbi:MAG: wax ester/triacylglycerol synthase family O-acyltransferase [Solirubrobacterales bacterium]|nr:wax ester/triacylglycerol synthase family O-acyltransferase [Solirubrobacterales bacterium]MBV9915587.1 wax ester/triacylglycerol synthase family O-acyltransferase [Solirubrobacterales bacterium]